MTDRRPVSVQIDDDHIAWVTIDSPPVNATSTTVRAGLLDAVSTVQNARLAVLQCAGPTFVAGGDMSEFDAPPAAPDLPDVVQAIEDSNVPFVALLHGSVLGGGLELALGCAWRIAHPQTRFGLPEVHVGLIAGAGGTQRLPRLVGMEMAISMAAGGRQIGAKRFYDAGGIDLIADDLTDALRQFVKDLPERPVPVSQHALVPLSESDKASLTNPILKRAKGQTSPRDNLAALEWAALPFADGQPRERALHLELRGSDQSIALRHAFFAERAVAKPQAISAGQPSVLEEICVVGGGLMGSGIATALLGGGKTVTLIEQDPAGASAALERVTANLAGAVKRGKLSKEAMQARLAAFTTTTDTQDAAACDLAIEAVFEDLTVKQAIFAQLAQVMRADAVLATNTSYLDPQDIFAGIPDQSRCLGLHFFSPAHLMKLTEIVRLPQTSADVLASAFKFAKSIGKTPVLSGICDGFIGNRMLSAYRRAAEYMLADGALPQDIDAAMVDFGMAMGPFVAQDMAGLQIAQANRKRQAAARDPKERYVTLSDQLCDLGRFGQRSGAGWYAYPDKTRQPVVDPVTTALIETYSADHGIVRKTFTYKDIQIRLLAVLANEGARIVEEGIAENDAAVDVVKTQGYGFPRWHGGPMHYAATVGADAIRASLAQVAHDSPNSWVRAQRYDDN